MVISSIFHMCVKIKIRKKCPYLVCPPLVWITAKQRRVTLIVDIIPLKQSTTKVVTYVLYR